MVPAVTLVERFQVVSVLPNIEKIRRRLLALGALSPANHTTAAERVLEILFKTPVRPILLESWEPVNVTAPGDAQEIQVISAQTQDLSKNFRSALREAAFLPKETVELLKDMFTPQDPLARLGILIFLVASTSVEDLL
jgi:hypothetical protein